MADIYASYPVSGGGGGVTSLDGLTGALSLVAGTGISIADGTNTITITNTAPSLGGTVTSVSVVSANGLAGTVATATTTPAITLSTTITGILQGNGTAISAASTTGTGNVVLSASPTLTGTIIAAAATFSGAISASNFSGNSSGTNTGDITIGTANGLSLSGQALSLGLSSTSTTGALSSTDWNTFNGKQAVGSYITSLTGDLTASGPGAAATTLATVNTNVGSFTYASITVNAKGLVTAASNGAAPVTTLGAVGASPNANAATISGNTLNLQPFSSTQPGVVTASGGGTTNFLRADGTFATPAGTANGFVYLTTGSAYGGTNSTLSFSGINNTIVGQGAGASLAAGTDNTLYGKGSGGTALTGNAKHVAIGSGAVVGSGQEDVVIGYTATSAGATTGTSVIIGSQASTSGTSGTAVAIGRAAISAVGVSIGFGAQMTGSGIIIGKNSTHAQSNSILIGNALSTSFNNTFIAGQSGSAVTPSTAANQVVFGVSGGAMKDLWLGQGAAAVAGTPSNISIQATGVVTTSNQVGGSFTLAAGNGTGTGGSGAIIFQTAPVGTTGATANTLATVGSISNTGAHTLGAASTSPAHILNGTLGFNGSSSGTVTVQTQAAAGTYNFNLPTTAGSSGQVLTSGGGSAAAMIWSSVATVPNVVAKTTTYSAVINDYITASNAGATYAITLPTAVGVSGQSIWMVRTDSTLTQITIATTSAQTVGGYASGVVTLATLNEVYQFTSDGANWQITNHGANTGWVSYTPTFVGLGTVTTVDAYWRREGTDLKVRISFVPGGTTGTTATVSFPSGLTSVSTISSIATEAGGYNYINVTSNGTSSVLNTPSASVFKFARDTSSLTALNPEAGSTLVAGGNTMSFNATVPILGWIA